MSGIFGKPFTSKEVKNLINEYTYIFQKITDALNLKAVYRQEIADKANDYINNETIKILQDVPVEELNRDKNGIRIKTLKDNGYKMLSEVAQASSESLASIYGISDAMALEIRQRVMDIAEATRNNVKVILNADNRTKEATDIIHAIYKYRNCDEAINEIKVSQAAYGDEVRLSLEKLSKGKNVFGWVFSSAESRDYVIEAYNNLDKKLRDEYIVCCKDALDKISRLDNAGKDFIWDYFKQNSVKVTNTLEEICPNLLGNNDLMYGLPEELAAAISNQQLLENGLLCELRNYQKWGVKYILHQKNVLLGDEMGLGKTVQAIAAMVS